VVFIFEPFSIEGEDMEPGFLFATQAITLFFLSTNTKANTMPYFSVGEFGWHKN
jgi:hypothetical protein